ncbi:MAG TPA: hypothetical protein VJO52_05380 [Gemmatimonadaceae bacterium]|nr:hypothetical protein [Gemmatimonadaceae bacterium]
MSDKLHSGLDAELAAALRRAAGEPPYGDVDWDGLTRRIHTAALGNRVVTVSHPWWEHLGGWMRAAIPLALAAGLAAFALIASDRSAARTPETPTFMEAVTGAASEQDVAVSVMGQPTTESFAAEVLAQ